MFFAKPNIWLNNVMFLCKIDKIYINTSNCLSLRNHINRWILSFRLVYFSLLSILLLTLSSLSGWNSMFSLSRLHLLSIHFNRSCFISCFSWVSKVLKRNIPSISTKQRCFINFEVSDLSSLPYQLLYFESLDQRHAI